MDNSSKKRVMNKVEDSQEESVYLSFKHVFVNFNTIYIFLSAILAAFFFIWYLKIANKEIPMCILAAISVTIIFINIGLVLIKLTNKLAKKSNKLFFLILKITSSKLFFLILLLVFNGFLLYFHYNFLPNTSKIEINAIKHDDFLTFMARIGPSWLFTLPYNFFLFFPLFISIYFRKSKYPERYVSAFLDVVSHENLVAVVLGLILNVLLSLIPLFFIYVQPKNPPEPLEAYQIVAFSQLWIGSLIIWLTPFFVSLTQLETKFEASFDRKLSSIIQKMKDHVVVIGYGNLGKKICSNLIEEGIVSSEKDFIEILYPDLEVRKICRSLLVVDLNNQWFDRVHKDPILEKVGVARSRENILIPAIIGDTKSEAIREGSNLQNSNLFILASADYAATFTMSKFANRVDANSIIAVRDSAQKDYFSPKMTAHDTFFVYPTFQAGISLGRILSLRYFKLAEKISEGHFPRIVIAGEGKQIHYLIETFWIEMQEAGIAENWKQGTAKYWANQKTYELPITILGEERNLVRYFNVLKPLRRGKYTKIEGITTRLARIDKINAWMLIDIVLDAPYKLKTIEKVIHKEKPEVVVITSKTIENVSKILHEWIVAVERYNSEIYKQGEFYKPVIIVGVLGDEYMEIQDILLYYSKIESMYKNLDSQSRTQFPTHLDSIVRVYDDSAEQISGLAYAFIRTKKSKGKTKYKDPFVLYCCLKDVSGSLGYILGKLASIEFKDYRFKGAGSPLSGNKTISLRFCRYQNCPDEHRYSFLANAELETRTNVDDEDRISHCLFQGKIENKEGEENIEYIKENLGVIGYGFSGNKNPTCEKQLLRKICSRCNRRITCPLSSYLRKVKNLVENRDNYKALEELGRIKEDIVDQEISRFLVNPGFKRSDIHNAPENSTSRAVILMCCKSKIPGSLAAAVNSLLFKEIDTRKSKNISSKTANRVTAVAYIKSSGCYDPMSSCFEFYGNFVDREPERIGQLMKEGVIDLVLINAVTEKQDWWNYANDLYNVLNTDSGTGKKNKYGLWLDREVLPNSSSKVDDYPDNIVIKIVEDENSDGLTFSCSKKDCVIHYKLKLIEKNGIQLDQ